MQLFTRTNTNTVKKTIAIYKQEIKREKSSFIKTFIFIPASDTLLLVILPLLTSFLVQSLITNPTNFTHALQLISGMCAVIVLGLTFNIHGYNNLFRHEERVITRLLTKASD